VLEITHNDRDNTYHPHFHVMLAVRPEYFHNDKYKPYISHGGWVRMWREAARLDYDPSVDIQAVKTLDNGRVGVAEVVKYTVKGNDYIYPDYEKAVPVVETLHDALFGRRLYFFGGCFADARKALKLGDVEKDLTDIEEKELRKETIVALERWCYIHNPSDWVLTSTDGPPPEDVREVWRKGEGENNADSSRHP